MNAHDDPHVKADVVIIGTGAAGLFTALNLDPSRKVIVFTKDKVEKSNSYLAQGGIAACLNGDNDVHYEDTIRAGAYYNKERPTKIMVHEAADNIEKLIKLGVHLDQDKCGKLSMTKEGGHSQRRILHWKDATGKELIRALKAKAYLRKNITIYENTFVKEILKDEGVSGIIGIKDHREFICESKVVVLATGGVGQVYKNTTNPCVATGDGIAMAHRVGGKICDMEFVQFHPTALYDHKNGQKFLISEAVRGEGAILRNHHQEAFMRKYHPLKELAPRDIVSRAIYQEMRKSNQPFVYLDMTHKKDIVSSRFPTIYQTCLERGLDIRKEWIPVTPVMHYMMGGIETDEYGKTNIKGLYACGECACSGVHGANRLASNSLLEALVFSRRSAQSIDQYLSTVKHKDFFIKSNDSFENVDKDYDFIKNKIQNIMDEYVSIIRNKKDLKLARKKLQEIQKHLSKGHSVEYYECANLCLIARLIVDASLKRKKSLGAYYREDEGIV